MPDSRGNKRLRIDGSYGEGGGQILRTALALSCALGRDVEIINIRKARKRPGLQPQHLTAVKAAAAISRARTEGAELSSSAVLFRPGAVSGGDYSFDVAQIKGSAGSTSLVLQTILLPLCLARRPSNISLIGGTHVPWSPVFHYLKLIFLPMLRRMGISIELDIERWGWYPIGGGRITAKVAPNRGVLPVTTTDRGKLLHVRGLSAVSNLPRDIAVRQRNEAVRILSRRGVDADIDIIEAPSPGKGTLVFLLAEYEQCTAGASSLGAIGKRAEEVAHEACQELIAHVDAGGACDPHLADQIIPYLALAEGASEISTSSITSHLLTNIWVVKQFHEIDIEVAGAVGAPGKIRIQSRS